MQLLVLINLIHNFFSFLMCYRFLHKYLKPVVDLDMSKHKDHLIYALSLDDQVPHSALKILFGLILKLIPARMVFICQIKSLDLFWDLLERVPIYYIIDFQDFRLDNA